MDAYGWDKYREQGLLELERIKKSRLLANKDGQKKLLERLIEVYKSGTEENIKSVNLFPELDEEKAYKNVSGLVRSLKKTFDDFYESDEGIQSDFEISFAAERGDYKLRIEPKKNNEQTKKHNGTVSYRELIHIVSPNMPFITRSIIFILSFVAPFLVTISVIILYVEKTHSLLNFIVGCVGLVLSILLGYTGRVLNKSCASGLAYYIVRYFLRITIQDLALVSYSGKCSVPECKGNIFLSNEFKKGTGYIAKCTDYPDGHRFSFDLITLRGERIRA